MRSLTNNGVLTLFRYDPSLNQALIYTSRWPRYLTLRPVRQSKTIWKCISLITNHPSFKGSHCKQATRQSYLSEFTNNVEALTINQ